MTMTDEQFMQLMKELGEYIDTKKVFIKNPARFNDVYQAAEIAKQLFQDYDISIEDDPLQMGALCLCINGFDITIKGRDAVQLFQKLIAKADNFEIYPVGNERVKFAIMFNGVLKRVPQVK